MNQLYTISYLIIVAIHLFLFFLLFLGFGCLHLLSTVDFGVCPLWISSDVPPPPFTFFGPFHIEMPRYLGL